MSGVLQFRPQFIETLMLLDCCLNAAKTPRLAFYTAASLEKHNGGKSLGKTFSLNFGNVCRLVVWVFCYRI